MILGKALSVGLGVMKLDECLLFLSSLGTSAGIKSKSLLYRVGIIKIISPVSEGKTFSFQEEKNRLAEAFKYDCC